MSRSESDWEFWVFCTWGFTGEVTVRSELTGTVSVGMSAVVVMDCVVSPALFVAAVTLGGAIVAAVLRGTVTAALGIGSRRNLSLMSIQK